MKPYEDLIKELISLTKPCCYSKGKKQILVNADHMGLLDKADVGYPKIINLNKP